MICHLQRQVRDQGEQIDELTDALETLSDAVFSLSRYSLQKLNEYVAKQEQFHGQAKTTGED